MPLAVGRGELHPLLIVVHWAVHQCTPGFQGWERKPRDNPPFGNSLLVLWEGVRGGTGARGCMASHQAMALGVGNLCSMARAHGKRRRMKRSQRKGRALIAAFKGWNKGVGDGVVNVVFR